MKYRLIKKISTFIIATTTMISLNSISANAVDGRWRNDGVGWWFMQPSGMYTAGWIQDNGKWYYLGSDGYMKTGWQQYNGKWYYLNNDGSMATNTTINGYQIDNNGVWIQNTNVNSNNTTNTSNTNSNNTVNMSTTNNVNSNNTTNLTTNVNNGIIINGNVNIGNTTNVNNTNSNNSLTNQQDNSNSTAKNYDGKDGFVKISDDKYVYYEDGQMLKNTWKKFDEGYRYFDKNGYVVFGGEVDGLGITSTGVVPLTNEYPFTKKQIFRDLQPYSHRGTVFISGNLDYIIKTYNIFDVKYEYWYTDVYDKQEDGKILSIGDKFINFDDNDEGKFEAKKIIQIGKYSDRIKLN